MNNIYYAHEHITIDLSGVKQDQDCRLDNFDQTVDEFKALAQRGVSSVIDQTARGMGRNINYVEKVAELSGIRIKHATGFYKAPFLPAECYERNERELSSLMVEELIIGMEGTSIKANHIGEVGTSLNVFKEEEQKVFAAACMAQLETGAAICTHTTLGTLALEQVDFFKQYRVPLDRVVLSHIDLSDNYDYKVRILDNGVNIAFDTIGKENYQPDSMRVEHLMNLCEAGYVDQIVLSLDITRKSHFKENGGLGYSYLIDNFLPRLEDAGCKQEWLNKMLTTNPARIYGE